MKVATALVAGVLFALGLVISGMTDPARVVGFLDVTGHWDPTLAFVMVAAIGIHAPFAARRLQRRAPLFDAAFHLPPQTAIDMRLLGGAAIFGVGWGLSGYCPGPALVSLGTGAVGTIGFVIAVLAGVAIVRLTDRSAGAAAARR